MNLIFKIKLYKCHSNVDIKKKCIHKLEHIQDRMINLKKKR